MPSRPSRDLPQREKMKSVQEERIPLQVGSELRIKNNGEITVSNPELELAQNITAADAVLSYRFDRETGEHFCVCLTRSPTTNMSEYIAGTISSCCWGAPDHQIYSLAVFRLSYPSST